MAINYTIWFTAVVTVHIASAMAAEMYEVGMRVPALGLFDFPFLSSRREDSYAEKARAIKLNVQGR